VQITEIRQHIAGLLRLFGRTGTDLLDHAGGYDTNGHEGNEGNSELYCYECLEQIVQFIPHARNAAK
jgi:hypothetical protein